MLAALEQAKLAKAKNEVPIGAVIYKDGQIIARSHNLVESNKNVAQHAEVLAITEASKAIGDWRLNDCILCVTIEPCTMCSGAIKLSRISTVIYGAADPSMGAFGSLYDISQDPRPGPVPRVITGVFENECASLVKDFFASKRSASSRN